MSGRHVPVQVDVFTGMPNRCGTSPTPGTTAHAQRPRATGLGRFSAPLKAIPAVDYGTTIRVG